MRESSMSIETFLDKNYPNEQVVLPAFIDQPSLQHWSQRGIFGIIAVAGLTLWGYLFVPILSLLAWWFGWYRFDQYIIQDYEGGFTENITTMIAAVMIMGLMLLGWASYNILRFYDRERRQVMSNVRPDEIAHFYEIQLQQVQQAKAAQMSIFTYDKKGKIMSITAISSVPSKDTYKAG